MLDSSLLKVIAFFGIWAVIWLPIAFFVARSIKWQLDRPLDSKQKLILLASLYILVPPIIWYKIKSEGLSLAELGWHWQGEIYLSLCWGFILAIAGLMLVFILESGLGAIDWQQSESKFSLSLILSILFLALSISAIEELVFRGYLINILTLDFSYWVAAIISSIIFALLHLVWERKETIPQLPGLWLMGMVLVGARAIDSGSLGLAWGLHAGWIWGLSYLDAAKLFTYRENSKSWLVGANQQPLAGVAGILCLLLTGGFLWLVATNLNGINIQLN